MPAGFDGIVVMHQCTAILVDGHPYIVHEEEAVVPELRLGLQEVSERAERQVGDGCRDDDEERLGVWVLPKIHPLGELLEAQQQDQRGHQVSPHIDGFIVLLEERGEVIAPSLVHRAIAGVDVRLPENPRHLRAADSGGQWGSQQLGDLAHVDEEAAEFLCHHRCHGAATLQLSLLESTLGQKDSSAVGFSNNFTKQAA